MRLIDGDALIEQLKSSSAYNDYEWSMYADGFIEDIENAPTIDVVPKDFHDKTCEAMAKRHTEEIQKFMWIPCSERLPREYSDGERVLATTDVDGLGVIIMPIYDVVSWYRKGYISAWVPLPKPYEEREDE